MAIISLPANHALADGTVITASNFPYEAQPDVVVPNGGTITAQTVSGRKVARVSGVASQQTVLGYSNLPGAALDLTARGIITLPATPGNDQTFFRLRGPTGLSDVGLGAVIQTSAGLLKASVDGSGSSVTGSAIGPGRYDCEIQARSGVGGFLNCYLRNVDTGSMVGSVTLDGGTMHASRLIGSVLWGKALTSAASAYSVDIEQWTVKTGATSGLPAPGTPQVTAPGSKIQGESTTSFTVTSNAVTHAWTVISKPAASTLATGDLVGASTTTVTVPNQSVAGSYGLQYVGTTGSTSTTIVVWLHVLPAANVGQRPYLVVDNSGAYIPGGTAATVLDGIASQDEAAYALSPAGGGLIEVAQAPAAQGPLQVLSGKFVWVNSEGDPVPSDGALTITPYIDGVALTTPEVVYATSGVEVDWSIELSTAEVAIYAANPTKLTIVQEAVGA